MLLLLAYCSCRGLTESIDGQQRLILLSCCLVSLPLSALHSERHDRYSSLIKVQCKSPFHHCSHSVARNLYISNLWSFWSHSLLSRFSLNDKYLILTISGPRERLSLAPREVVLFILLFIPSQKEIWAFLPPPQVKGWPWWGWNDRPRGWAGMQSPFTTAFINFS